MNKQRGFVSMNFTADFVRLIVFGAFVGLCVGVLLCKLPWLWSLIKPIIHGLTA